MYNDPAALATVVHSDFLTRVRPTCHGYVVVRGAEQTVTFETYRG
jgi:hypothetical protein